DAKRHSGMPRLSADATWIAREYHRQGSPHHAEVPRGESDRGRLLAGVTRSLSPQAETECQLPLNLIGVHEVTSSASSADAPPPPRCSLPSDRRSRTQAPLYAR